MRKLSLAALGLLVVGLLLWRWLSRRTVLPCPWWLSALVDNGFMDRLAGAERLLDRAGVGVGATVLDVGCGPGRISVPAARRVGKRGRVLALDVQPQMIERTRRRAERAGVEVETVVAAAGDGTLDERGAFDAAFLVTVLGEIPVPVRGAALAEIHRALRPGGILSVIELLPDPHFQSQRAVARLGRSVGFDIGPVFGWRGAYTLHLLKR